jgi:hypothetical protein
MNKLLTSAFLSFALITSAAAQDAKQAPPADAKETPPATDAAPHKSEARKDATESLRQLIQERLASAGFTDIELIPTSFLISARGPDGRVVTLMVSPRPAPELEDEGPDQDSQPSSEESSTTDQSDNGKM